MQTAEWIRRRAFDAKSEAVLSPFQVKRLAFALDRSREDGARHEQAVGPQFAMERRSCTHVARCQVSLSLRVERTRLLEAVGSLCGFQAAGL